SSYYAAITAAEVVTYGINNRADISAENIQMSSTGTTFLLKTPFGNEDISMKLVGKFNVYNVLAAAAASLVSGVSLDSIKYSLERMAPVPGRLELVDEGQDFSVIVDYAHTPDSLLNVLKTIKQFAKGKLYVVVGCGGDRDKKKRPLMAEISVKYADEAIFTSDNPRSEDPHEIIRDMTHNLQGGYVAIIDRKAAIDYAIQQAKPGDVVLIAGKGHETEQIIGDKVFPFDDRKVAREAIKRRQRL